MQIKVYNSDMVETESVIDILEDLDITEKEWNEMLMVEKTSILLEWTNEAYGFEFIFEVVPGEMK